ncbi:hypothetical protein AMECASPLE_025160 [Ameca splendens]|uniref:Uncharacterized protein n=1 Tax=Ameca splendens TaxID=208324 RepID=A0ABV0YG02_9TELE
MFSAAESERGNSTASICPLLWARLQKFDLKKQFVVSRLLPVVHSSSSRYSLSSVCSPIHYCQHLSFVCFVSQTYGCGVTSEFATPPQSHPPAKAVSIGVCLRPSCYLLLGTVSH